MACNRVQWGSTLDLFEELQLDGVDAAANACCAAISAPKEARLIPRLGHPLAATQGADIANAAATKSAIKSGFGLDSQHSNSEPFGKMKRGLARTSAVATSGSMRQCPNSKSRHFDLLTSYSGKVFHHSPGT